MRGFVVSVAVLGVCGMAGVARSQPMFALESPNPDSAGHFGWCVSWLGDADADGYADVLVGAPDESIPVRGHGRVFAYAGIDASLIFTIESPTDGSRDWYDYYIGGTAGAAVGGVGDLNGDGHDDVLIGMATRHQEPGGMPWWSFSSKAYSGVAGESLWIGYSAHKCRPAGDRNGDGLGDALVLAILSNAYICNGSDGSTLLNLVPPDADPSTSLSSVSGIGDLDAGPCEATLIGAYSADGGAPDAGRAYVFDNATGEVAFVLESASPEGGGWFGVSVSGAGEVDGDEAWDFIVGAHEEDGGANDAGRAYVFSGSDGGLLHTLLSPAPEDSGRFGRCLAAIGDVNGDGFDDILIGAPYEDGGAVDAGRAYVFSGTGALLATLESPNPELNGLFGCSLDGIGDANGDGIPEFAIGAPYEDGGATDAGRVYVYSGGTVPVELTGFTAVARNGDVLLTWSTLSEIETFGFHVYRSLFEALDYTRITASIIPGAGTSSVRHDYSYIDAPVQPGSYFYKLGDVDFGGNETLHAPVSVTVLPMNFTLQGAHPNPFSESTTLRINLPCNGHLNVTVHNLAGERVRMLLDGEMDAGVQEIVWDGRDDAGKPVAPGTYTFSAESEDRVATTKSVLIE